MSRFTTNLIYAAVLGQFVGALGWINPLFIPLVLAGPPVSGAILASRGVDYRWIAVLWASAGLGMLWSDWLINREDVLFHLALAVIMPMLAGIGWGLVRLTRRQLSRPSAVNATREMAVRLNAVLRGRLPLSREPAGRPTEVVDLMTRQVPELRRYLPPIEQH